MRLPVTMWPLQRKWRLPPPPSFGGMRVRSGVVSINNENLERGISSIRRFWLLENIVSRFHLDVSCSVISSCFWFLALTLHCLMVNEIITMWGWLNKMERKQTDGVYDTYFNVHAKYDSAHKQEVVLPPQFNIIEWIRPVDKWQSNTWKRKYRTVMMRPPWRIV